MEVWPRGTFPTSKIHVYQECDTIRTRRSIDKERQWKIQNSLHFFPFIHSFLHGGDRSDNLSGGNVGESGRAVHSPEKREGSMNGFNGGLIYREGFGAAVGAECNGGGGCCFKTDTWIQIFI